MGASLTCSLVEVPLYRVWAHGPVFCVCSAYRDFVFWEGSHQQVGRSIVEGAEPAFWSVTLRINAGQASVALLSSMVRRFVFGSDGGCTPALVDGVSARLVGALTDCGAQSLQVVDASVWASVMKIDAKLGV